MKSTYCSCFHVSLCMTDLVAEWLKTLAFMHSTLTSVVLWSLDFSFTTDLKTIFDPDTSTAQALVTDIK